MEDLYFKNEEARLIFRLVELEGKKQVDFLGVDCEHFYNRTVAKDWYEKTKVELEASEHKMRDRALEMLYQIYEMMVA